MSIAQTRRTEIMHARWVHARRYRMMTRAVAVVVLLTAGMVMHATMLRTSAAAIDVFAQNTSGQDQTSARARHSNVPVAP